MSSALTGQQGIRVSRGNVFSFPVHSHSYFELILYQPFVGHVQVNDNRLSAQAPLALLMTPSDLHSITVMGETAPFIKIAFLQGMAGEYLLEQLTAPRLLSPVPDQVHRLFQKMAEERPHAELIILLRALLLEMVEGSVALPAPTVSGKSALMTEAMTVIGDAFQQDLTLEGLALRLNVSYQHLSSLFHKQLGVTFSAYLTDIRLRHAAALLSDSSLSVTEICYACGYRNLSHFLRSFKKRYGATPKQYRAKNLRDP